MILLHAKASGFRDPGNIVYFVIPSEARNPSGIESQ